MPMSPRPAAPSSASLHAWAIASASLCPSSPRSPSNTQPASTSTLLRVVGESVDVEALPDSQVAGVHRSDVRSDLAAGPLEVAGFGDLAVVRVAADHDDGAAGGFDERGVIGRVGPGRVCGTQPIGTERLRCLHGDESGAVGRLDDVPRSRRSRSSTGRSIALIVSVTATAGIAASAPSNTAIDHSSVDVGRRQRASGIVDADHIGRRRDRSRARRAPMRSASHRPQPLLRARHRRRARRAPRRRCRPRRRRGRCRSHGAHRRASYCLRRPNRLPLPPPTTMVQTHLGTGRIRRWSATTRAAMSGHLGFRHAPRWRRVVP